MSAAGCPTVGCANAEVMDSYNFDHYGVPRFFCVAHNQELFGVRQQLHGLLAQIEGLHQVLAMAKMVVNPVNMQLAADLQNTLLEQGALLIQLIKRERELTGASKV